MEWVDVDGCVLRERTSERRLELLSKAEASSWIMSGRYRDRAENSGRRLVGKTRPTLSATYSPRYRDPGFQAFNEQIRRLN